MVLTKADTIDGHDSAIDGVSLSFPFNVITMQSQHVLRCSLVIRLSYAPVEDTTMIYFRSNYSLRLADNDTIALNREATFDVCEQFYYKDPKLHKIS